MELKNTRKQEIPIFFSTDDNYVPFLDVAIRSLKQNSSKDYFYKIVVLNTGLKEENIAKVKLLEDENFSINFANISYAVEDLKSLLPNQYHFGLATWYRLFIQNLFPEYHKILYLDCDIVVTGDISKLYNVDLEGNMLAGVVEQFILRTKEFSDYTKYAVGVDAKNYLNAGILVIDLDKFRQQRIEEKFTYLINKYNFDVIDPDQGYINFLCQGRIKYLPVEFNRTPLECIDCPNPVVVHYALYKKPWQYDDVFLGEYFWQYAKESPFYADILKIKDSFDDEARTKKEKAGVEIKEHGIRTLSSNNTFVKVFELNPAEKNSILDETEKTECVINFSDIFANFNRARI